MEIAKEVEAGQAVYTKSVLSIYDFWVLGISNRFIWKCPTSNILALFNKHITANHLDIGVGTGYFLDKCEFQSNRIRLGLMDLNQNSLEVAKSRLKRYSPETYRGDILGIVDEPVEKYGSVSINYLLHCLPGDLMDKSIVFKNVHSLLKERGTVFGSTLLHNGVDRSAAARKLMKIYNEKKIFSNQNDDVDKLKQVLSDHYPNYDIKVIGCAALFWATK